MDTLTRTLKEAKSLNRGQVISSLRKFSQEWQKQAEEEGQDLLEVRSSVGLLIYDILQSLGLSEQEQALVLGADLPILQEVAGDPITQPA